MVCAGAPKSFWADTIKLKAYVCLNMAHNIYSLQGEVPETMMSGKTLDLSQFCKFAFYDWVMFCDEPIAFLDDNPMLGQYLGSAINVGPALTAKILKANREVFYCLTYPQLTTTKVSNAAYVSRRIEFDISIMDRYGLEIALDNFPDLAIPNTSKLNLFNNIDIEGRDKDWVKRWFAFTGMDEGSSNGVDDEDPIPSLGINVSLPTPEFGDNYVHASVMLPHGNSFARSSDWLQAGCLWQHRWPRQQQSHLGLTCV